MTTDETITAASAKTDNEKLHDEVLDAIRSRTTWEQRQRVWYQMRHEGLRRLASPFPGAADLHYPLIDGVIDAFKPYYFSQIVQGDKLAQFTATEQKSDLYADAAAEWFSWYTCQNTEFIQMALSCIDTMCLRARGIVKVWWNVEEERLQFEAVDPQFLIVPPGTTDLDKADWIVHVKRLSRRQYEREKRYRQDAEFVTSICGDADSQGGAGMATEDKFLREGITHDFTKDIVLIWEVYEQTTNGWKVRTFSPVKPTEDVRPPFDLIYKSKDKAMQPFQDFVFEIKDLGWYAARGVAERLAPFEASLCKLWNEKHDFMTFANKPVFTASDPLPNTGNFRFGPGELLPKGVMPMEMPQPPGSIEADMMMQRSVAEQYIAVPSAGIAPDPMRGGSREGNPTATQVNYQAQLASGGTNLRGYVFRMSLIKLFRKSWALVCQFKPKSLTYRFADELKTLPDTAMNECYQIEPNGSPDAWNRNDRIGRAYARFQTFNNDPMINQEELRKEALGAEDGRLVRKLFVGQGMTEANEKQDEALDIVLMMAGWPAIVKPGENHYLRLQVILGKLLQLQQTHAPVDPIAKEAIKQHIHQHLGFLQQQDPKAFRMAVEAFQALEEAHAPAAMQLPQSPMGPPQLPQAGQPGPGMMPQPAPMPGNGPSLNAQPKPQLEAAMS